MGIEDHVMSDRLAEFHAHEAPDGCTCWWGPEGNRMIDEANPCPADHRDDEDLRTRESDLLECAHAPGLTAEGVAELNEVRAELRARGLTPLDLPDYVTAEVV